MKKIALFCIVTLACAAQALNAAPFKKIKGGGVQHVASGVVFPAKVGLFQFAGTQVYDRTGRDVSGRYLLDGLILGDVYSYPVGPERPNLPTEFKIQKEAIQRLNSNVKLARQEKVSVNQNGRTISGLHGDYSLQRDLLGHRNLKCGSQLYVFRDGPWFVEYRFSYPRDKSDVALQHIAQFVKQWQWKQSGEAAPTTRI